MAAPRVLSSGHPETMVSKSQESMSCRSSSLWGTSGLKQHLQPPTEDPVQAASGSLLPGAVSAQTGSLHLHVLPFPLLLLFHYPLI